MQRKPLLFNVFIAGKDHDDSEGTSDTEILIITDHIVRQLRNPV